MTFRTLPKSLKRQTFFRKSFFIKYIVFIEFHLKIGNTKPFVWTCEFIFTYIHLIEWRACFNNLKLFLAFTCVSYFEIELKLNMSVTAIVISLASKLTKTFREPVVCFMKALHLIQFNFIILFVRVFSWHRAVFELSINFGQNIIIPTLHCCRIGLTCFGHLLLFIVRNKMRFALNANMVIIAVLKRSLKTIHKNENIFWSLSRHFQL